MTQNTESGQFTGTPDKDYNLIPFAEECLSNALRMETFKADAERAGDDELVELFTKAQQESTKGAERAKRLLADRLVGA